jgi:hypothetical protein
MTTAARLKLSALLEMYTPCNASRTAALDALRKGVEEFETEVRADERAQVLAAQPATIPLNFTETPAAPPATPADPQFTPPPQVPSGELAQAASEARAGEQRTVLAEEGDHLPEPLGRDADAPADVIPPADVTTVADLVPPVLTPPSGNVVVDPKPDAPNSGRRRR